MLQRLVGLLKSNRLIKTVEFIRDEKFTIKLTRRFKTYKYPRSEDTHEDIVLTQGRPGYLTRALIQKWKKLGTDCRGQTHIKYFPKKKVKKNGSN